MILILAVGTAHAHSGYESETDIRLFPDRMEVNVRTTYLFAWRILGERAPRDTGEEAQEAARQLLASEAPGLFDVRAGEEMLTAKNSKCVYELDEHVVFLLTYDRPAAWPLVMRAKFFDRFDPLTTSTVSFFDLTADPYHRDVEALAKKHIHRGEPVFEFEPKPAGAKTETAPEAKPAMPEKPVAQEIGYGRRVAIWLTLAVVLFLLVRYVRR